VTIQLVTVAQVKAMLGATAAFPDDAVLTTIVQMVSGAMERYLGRELENTGTDRVEYFNGDGRRRIFPLRRFPIASVTSVYEDEDRTYGSSTLISTDDYAVHADPGFLEFEYPLDAGVRNVKISYKGGYTASSSVLPVPDAMKHACILQSAEVYRRRETMTLIGMSTDLGNISAPVTFDVMDLTPGVKRLLDPFKAQQFGGM